MPWTAPQNWSAGQLVTASDLNTDIRDNANILRTDSRTAAALASRFMGGDYQGQMTDAAYTTIPGHVEATIDGDEVTSLTLEFMAYVDAGTGNVRLYNVTTAAAIGAVTAVTGVAATRHRTTGLTPTAGENVYRLQAHRGTTWIRLWGCHLYGTLAS